MVDAWICCILVIIMIINPESIMLLFILIHICWQMLNPIKFIVRFALISIEWIGNINKIKFTLEVHWLVRLMIIMENLLEGLSWCKRRKDIQISLKLYLQLFKKMLGKLLMTTLEVSKPERNVTSLQGLKYGKKDKTSARFQTLNTWSLLTAT